MNQLDINNINRMSPYGVRIEDGEYWFHTDYDIVYAIEFEPEDVFDIAPAYWFGIANRSHKASPNDPKVRATIICIIEEFFRVNPDILLYMCDSADDQQSMRNRLFLRWFHGYEQQKLYVIRTALIMDEDTETYVAIIVQKNNPLLETILERFEDQVGLFKEDKPL
jgi:hypothetical protein